MSKQAVLAKEDRIYYVSTSDFISFIEQNTELEWNQVCRIVQEMLNEEGRTYVTAKCFEYLESEYSYGIWFRYFFETHNWLERVMFVFDD